MNRFTSALYRGMVVHERFRPRRHRLRYPMFQMLLDLDEAPALARQLKWFSHNRFNLFSFYDQDHGVGDRTPLRDYVARVLASAGLDLGAGKVTLLCMPRILGHVFNPLSLYFCHAADGALAAMIYEVNNTFGQRHSYLIPVGAVATEGEIHQSCAKAFYVSPFMDMAMNYDFEIKPPGSLVATTVHGRGPDGALIIAAAFSGTRTPLTDAALLRALLDYRLLTLKVVAAIHWEALKLIFKGLRLKPRPPAPAQAVTIAGAQPWPDLHKTIKQSA